MKVNTKSKRIFSLALAVILAAAMLTPAASAFADDGVVGYYDIELFYEDGTIVPTYQEDGETKYIEYMTEGDTLQLTYQFIDCELPDNGYVTWYSETPTLVDVDQNGLVKAFDSSKGAVIQTWIDNEVKTIPLVGSIMATIIEKALFNDYIDVDTMDTEAIVDAVEALFGSGSALSKWSDSYKGELIDSLREYLNNINSNVHVCMYDSSGTLLDDDYIQICVEKNDAVYANFLPNGTHITNKSQINTTVAVGSTVQLEAVTTPVRLEYGVVYSVKSSSIFSSGKVVATVNDSGLVTFKNTGEVTIMVSPDSEQVIENILKLINYFYALDNTGTIDTDQIAGILIDYVGLDINRTVLTAILDICFAVSDIVSDTADPVQLTATAVEIIANLVLQFAYNDTITFNVVEAEPLTNFNIDGATTVQEGAQIQLSIVDIEPSAGDTSDITWTSSDPSIASVDPKTGVITGRDAGGSLGSLSTNTCMITATSAANNISKSVTITVTGKTGKYLSDAEILGKTNLQQGEETDYSYTVYPARVSESDNLYISWGIVTGTDEDGDPVYSWATDPYEETVTDEETGEETVVSYDGTVTDGIGTIDKNGHYTATDGGNCTIAMKAVTGYYLTSQSFYEISSYIATLTVTNGVPIEKITITPADVVSDAFSKGGTLSINSITVEGQEYTYATVKIGVASYYYDKGVHFTSEIEPANASNQNLTWVIENADSGFESSVSSDTSECDVYKKAAKEYTEAVNVYAVSADGDVVSNMVTICVTRNYALTNEIDQDSIDITRGKTASATHTMTFDGSWESDSYACYGCNWYSSDESVFTVENNNDSNYDATLTGIDVGTATLYCVSADGGIIDSCAVTVYPNKDYLRSIVELCDCTSVVRTDDNRALYKEYMKQLDYAYYILYDEPMASQDVCDTYAKDLLYSFYKVGGFVGINSVSVLDKNREKVSGAFITVDVSTTSSYKNYSYDFDYQLNPTQAMYSDIEWSSSNDSIAVDKNGVCTPAQNAACSAVITCTVTDYMGNMVSDSCSIAFARIAATGVSLNITSIIGGKVGETQQLTATVLSANIFGIAASVQDVMWESSDDSVASVDENGTVTFNRGGDCVITCTTCDGGYTAQCSVNVVTNYDALQLLINKYNDLSLNETNYYPESWETFTAAMAEAQAMIDAAKSSQSEVDEMYQSLESAYNGLKKYTYIQKVELYLDGEATNEFYQYDLSLLSDGISYTNAQLDLNVRLYPNNADYDTVVWEASTTDISVTTAGVCSPTSNQSCYGMITCTVTDHFGNSFSDSVWVSFAYYPVTGVQLSESAIAGEVGDTYQLTATIQPTGTSMFHIGAASIQDYYWESDDESVATVSDSGLITFVSAGSTVVRAVSYDGGFYGECQVSTQGDRNALRAALERYADIDYTNYEYSYGMTFKAAYEAAQNALTDNTLSQNEIDAVADALTAAGEALAGHEYIKAESIDIAWAGYKSSTLKESGTVDSTDAVSINMNDGGYSNFHYLNSCKLTASVVPNDAMYASVTWTVEQTEAMNTSQDGTSITLTPSKTTADSYAVVTVTMTDDYGRSVSRTVTVVMAWNVVTGITLDQTAYTTYATSGVTALTATLSASGSSYYNTVTWSSDNEDVATVDENGNVTPVEKGTAVITARTFDGGYTASCTVTVLTDFTDLAAKELEYQQLIDDVKDSYEYTEASLEVLQAAVAQAKEMLDAGTATQAEVNNMLQALNDAYNGLEEYILAESGTIAVDTESQSNVTVVNDGFIRYTGTAINGKTIQLTVAIEPQGAQYDSVVWTSSDSNITVDDTGLCTHNSSSAGYALITCTVTNANGKSFSDTVYVSFVRYGVTAVSFSEDTVFGAPGQQITLSPTVTASGSSSTGSVKDCIYSSDNESVATVDENGVVTFLSQGTAVITAVTADGGYSAQINAYTTWDTTALQQAIADAQSIEYTDYEYAYGTAFKEAYDAAVTVYENYYSSQTEIDEACAGLITAVNNLEGHEFISPVLQIERDGTAAENGKSYEIDENGQVILAYSMNEDAMVKSVQWSVSDENGVSAAVDENNQLVITKTGDTSGSLTVMLTAVDDYDREVVETVTINIVDAIIPITGVAITRDGETVDSAITYSCGGSNSNLDLTLGYITYPENANPPVSVTWSSSSSNYVTVSDGVIELTSIGLLRSSNTSDITVTVTLDDGTQYSATVTLTITRK